MSGKWNPPLKLRMLLRDQWDPQDSRVNKPRGKLAEELGLPVNITVNWDQIFGELESDAEMDPALTRFLTTDCTDIFERTVEFICEFMRSMYQKLRSDEDWGLSLLDRVGDQHLNIIIKSQRNKTPFQWNPYGNPNGTVEFRLESTMFTSRGDSKALGEYYATEINSDGQGNDGGEEIPFRTKQREHAPPPPPPPPPPPGLTTFALPEVPLTPERMPTLRDLSDPKRLFATSAPYIMYVTIFRSHVSATPAPYGQSVRLMKEDEYHSYVEINGSHEPSLQLMQEYFTQYPRHDTNVRGPVVKVELQEGYFRDRVKDTLFIKPYESKATWIHVGPSHILSFIEGVLGYSYMGTVANSLMYRRSRPFA